MSTELYRKRRGEWESEKAAERGELSGTPATARPAKRFKKCPTRSLPSGILDRLVRWAQVELHVCYRCGTEEILPGEYLEHLEVTERRKVAEDPSLAVGDVLRAPGRKGRGTARPKDVKVVVQQYACPGCAALTPRQRAARVPA